MKAGLTVCLGLSVLYFMFIIVHRKFIKKSQIIHKIISTHLLIMEVDFCPVLCIAEMPILRAFVAFSHFVWYRRISSNELQMV